MKDLPHHMKKLNRRIIRSMHREEMEEAEVPEIPAWTETERQKRKKSKTKMRTKTQEKVSSAPTPEERNKIMKGGRKGRVPIFDRNNAAPKHTRASKKKTPRI